GRSGGHVRGDLRPRVHTRSAPVAAYFLFRTGTAKEQHCDTAGLLDSVGFIRVNSRDSGNSGDCGAGEGNFFWSGVVPAETGRLEWRGLHALQIPLDVSERRSRNRRDLGVQGRPAHYASRAVAEKASPRRAPAVVQR